MPEEEVHNQIAIYADHSNIVKFTGRTDKNYLTVRSKLREVLEKVPAILLQRNARTANSM